MAFSALGSELDKYLKLARSLRDGTSFDTNEQIHCLALQYLHRFEYNTTDAACSLYARHSIDIPKPITPQDATKTDPETQWLTSFYRLMRLSQINKVTFEEMTSLQNRVGQLHLELTEVGVLERLLSRLNHWLIECEEIAEKSTDRILLQQLLYQAEDLTFEVSEKTGLEQRVALFDVNYGRLKDAINRNHRRNQSKSQLEEVYSCKLVYHPFL